MRKNLPFLLLLFNVIIATAQINPKKIDKNLRFLITQKEAILSGKKISNYPSPFKLDSKVTSKSNGKEKYGCIIYTSKPENLVLKGIEVQTILPKFVTALVSIDQIAEISNMKEVSFIESPENVELNNDIAVASTGASLLHSGVLNNTVYKGKGVIVGICDSGIDWKHPDFRELADQTKSRILSIWDQTITATGAEVSPNGFTYGVEYQKAHIDDELDGSPTSFVREADTNGHGTHVSGTVAGNGAALTTRKHTGMAPEADIVFVKAGNGSFPTTNVVDAITYFKNIAILYNRPVVVNMSLGGQFGAHDGTRPHEIAVDDFTSSGPGRVVVISAGNDNGLNLHKKDVIVPGNSATTSFTVSANTTAADVFAYRLYLNDASNVSATFTAPSGESVTALADESKSLNVTTDSFIMYVDNFVDPANGDRYIEVYVDRNGTNTTDSAGTWSLSVTNNDVANITTDGWLYYRTVPTTLMAGDSNSLIGSPSNATNAISVASFVGRLGWYSNNTGTSGGYIATLTSQDGISSFSAVGPRRDGVQKPDVAATGQNVISAMATGTLATTSTDNVDGTYYRKNQGTSMAAPVVTGAVALMLQAKPSLTFSEVKTALRNNAQVDEATGAVPNYSWGYGKADVYRATASVLECTVPNRKTIKYETPYASTADGNAALTTQLIAVNFTPDITGKLGGVYMHTVSNTGAGGTFNLTSLTIEVRSVVSGNPDAVLASKVLNPSEVAKFSWNYFNLSDLNLDVVSGTDYSIVFVPGAGSTWGVRRDNTVVDGRSRVSSNGGTTWSTPALDYRIRSVVYESTPAINNLATTSNLSDSKIITDTAIAYFTDNCQLLASVEPNAGSPISGKTDAKVWLESSQDAAYVKRHFEITPAANASTSTGKVTLYFSQQEFDDYNAVNTVKLPSNSTDDSAKANVLVVKYPGVSNDGSGLPASYTNGNTEIDPVDTDVVWDNTYGYWKVSFNTNGFSGFFLKSNTTLSTVENSKLNVLIYPNPSRNFINLSFSETKNVSVSIYDIVGRIVKTESLSSSNTYQINISDLPQGNYILKVNSDSGSYSKQIIKI